VSRDANELEREARAILEEIRARFPEHGAALDRVRIRISRRLVRSAGNAHPQTGLVQLSEPIFRLDENAPMFRNTVLHEIAHVIAGPAARAHGREWRAIFLSLGGDGRRTHTLRAAREHHRLPALCLRCAGTVEIGARRLRRLLLGLGEYVHVGCGGRIVPAERPAAQPTPALHRPGGRRAPARVGRRVESPRGQGYARSRSPEEDPPEAHSA